jgi:molybdopterin molybdotransferase
MLEYEQALQRILSSVPSPQSETVSLTQAVGRVVTEPVASPIDLPPFDNSAIDGYAVRAIDTAGATAAAPVKLRLIGRAAAGEPFDRELKAGESVRLFTGSMLPKGADAAVMQEDTTISNHDSSMVTILESVKPWENIRFRGEDVKRNQILLEPGTCITARSISLLAGAGVTELRVGRRPLIGVIATGTELQQPGTPLGPGEIYESNRVGLGALIERAGAVGKIYPLLPDVLEATQAALEKAMTECDAVVTCGGVSVGEMDFVKAAFEHAGGKVDFWKVAIKPGRPFVMGQLGEKFLFGLPGNPVSALVTFLLLVRPALARWQGAKDATLASCPGTLAESLQNPGERRHFMRVRMDRSGRVRSAGVQASHILSSLANANGLVDLPPRTTLAAGAPVQVLLLD